MFGVQEKFKASKFKLQREWTVRDYALVRAMTPRVGQNRVSGPRN